MAQYLESIRPGHRNLHLVIVGAKLPVALELLPPDIPVWWLKLDGLHLWPPRHLDLPTQAAVHAQQLSDAIPSGTILLCGHSYGGLLAIEIAQHLKKAGRYDLELILLEPSIPRKQNASLIERIVEKARQYKKRFRLRLIQELALALYKKTFGRINRMMISARQSADQEISTFDRWRFMAPLMLEQIHAFQLPDSISQDVHVIETSFYPGSHLDALKQITKGSLHVHEVRECKGHQDLALPQHSLVWMNIVLQLIDRYSIRDSISTSDQLHTRSASTEPQTKPNK